MSNLVESEVWDRLRSSLRSAIDLCDKLAKEPGQGLNYLQMIKELALIEGGSRQLATFRLDARWTSFGFEMARFHDRIGDAIRSHAARTIFLHMKGMMEGALAAGTKMKDAKTGRRGPILPRVRPGPHRQNRPVYVKSPAGLLLPTAH